MKKKQAMECKLKKKRNGRNKKKCIPKKLAKNTATKKKKKRWIIQYFSFKLKFLKFNVNNKYSNDYV